jgi:hypothetical protein
MMNHYRPPAAGIPDNLLLLLALSRKFNGNPAGTEMRA